MGGSLIGVVAGASVGSVKGAVIGGVGTGIAGLHYAESTANADRTEARKVYDLEVSTIRKTNPNAARRSDFMDNKRRELRKCDRLPPRIKQPFYTIQSAS